MQAFRKVGVPARLLARVAAPVRAPLWSAATSLPAASPAPAYRAFAAAASAPLKKPKIEDGTLEGRYATALFMSASDRLDKVYADLAQLKAMMAESPEFKLIIEMPGIDSQNKIEALDAVCKKIGADPTIMNFLKVLVENRRLFLLGRMIDLFETFYRTEKGLVVCKVTSAKELTPKQKDAVKSALAKRAEKGSTLIMEYSTNPGILGGLVVKMGEAVLDSSVNTKLERLQTQLLAPLA